MKYNKERFIGDILFYCFCFSFAYLFWFVFSEAIISVTK